jgi:AraC family transcriptional regulator, transcriptional activator of pobA
VTGLKQKGFKIFETPLNVYPPLSYERRDYYKMALTTGDVTIHYGDQTIDASGTFLFFSNPHVPYSAIQRSIKKTGFICLFPEGFVTGRELSGILKDSSLYRFDGTPVVRLSNEEAVFFRIIFQKMLSAYLGDYANKEAMVRNCVHLIIHEALSIQPQNLPTQKNAATRIAHLFAELLERQFPIENTDNPLKLRAAQDYAESLSVHVNYLNRSVKEVTGKPTSVHISERIVAEAKALLQHTDWSVADIAYGLGFEYPTYFNNYFKRSTGVTPGSYRRK